MSARVEFRRFCSERCKTLDIGAWASGGYGVPVAESDDTPTDAMKNDAEF